MNTKHIVGICFACAYILICLVIYLFNIGDGWGGIYVFFLAFPFSMFSGFVADYIGGAPVFLIMNTFWWYFLGRLFYYIKNKRVYD